MDNKNEIMKKYSLFLKAKKIKNFSGTLSVFFLFSFFMTWKYDFNVLAIFMLILSIVLIGIFIMFWFTAKPMQKHILNLIEENKTDGN